MNPFEMLAEGSTAPAPAQRISGVVIGIVTNVLDPDGLARVKVKFPWLSDSDESNWARVAMPMAGSGRGLQLMPDVNDEVLVVFEHGDMRFPYVLGGLWNGKDKPPAANADGKNNLKVLKSRAGHLVRLDDETGQEKIEIIDASGTNRVVIDTSSNTITISSDKDIKLSAPKGTIKLEAGTIELKSTGAASVEAAGTLTLKGSTVNIN